MCVCILFVCSFELLRSTCEEIYYLHFIIEEIGPDNFHFGHASVSGCLPVFVSVSARAASSPSGRVALCSRCPVKLSSSLSLVPELGGLVPGESAL